MKQENIWVYQNCIRGCKYVVNLKDFVNETLNRDTLSKDNRNKLEEVKERIEGLEQYADDGFVIGVLAMLNDYGVILRVNAKPLWESKHFQYHTNSCGDAYYHVVYFPMKPLNETDKNGRQIYLLETGEEVVIDASGGCPECFGHCVVKPAEY